MRGMRGAPARDTSDMLTALAPVKVATPPYNQIMPGLNQKYFYNKAFEQRQLSEGISKFLIDEPLAKNHTPESGANLARLANRLSLDSRVTDIRWMAYMLATITPESRELQAIQVALKTKDGSPRLDPKTRQPVTRTVNLWKMYDPASEIGKGHGLAYYEAVKVNALPDGTVEITEPDGDRFHVGTNGQLIAGKGFQPVTRRGSPSGGPLSKVYVDAPGTSQRYFGRGLVQLTWWNGYAATSAAMGWKLELLVDPDRMLDFEVSYEVMVRGMTTGIGYANNLTLGMYLSDSTTDYKGARAIINGKDRADEFAAIALRLETVLMDARQP